MAILKNRDLTNPAPDMRVASGQMRRSVQSAPDKISGALRKRPAAIVVVLGMLGAMLLMSSIWFLFPVVTAAYLLWFVSRRSNLPFRNPMSWGGDDYSEAHPAIDGKFGKSGGILCMGVTGRTGQATRGEELWITNSDARRHMVIIGTTGSGKALPLDTLVLTPFGWRRNGDLKPGDRLVHPHGGTCRVQSVHPQGVQPVIRIWFSDGRFTDCSPDHLWEVHSEPLEEARRYAQSVTADARARGLLETSQADLAALSGPPEGRRVMEARDLGILHGAYASRTSEMRCLRLTVPVPRPSAGCFRALGPEDATRAAGSLLERCPTPPALSGTPEERRAFLRAFLERRGGLDTAEGLEGRQHLVQQVRSRREASLFKELIWSLGGVATLWEAAGPLLEVHFALPGGCGLPGVEAGFLDDERLEIAGVEPLDGGVEMSCIKIDREDGLYVVEGYVTTHNTELLLGLVSQALMWSSGFLFIDGKGTRVFYARIWSLAKRFGREDDVRVVNFMGVENTDRPAGGPTSQTNTMNPFAKGSADNLMNLVVSLMGDAGSGNDMWKSRAMSLVTSAMKALVEMRESGDILLNVQAVRDFLPLGEGFLASKLGPKAGKIEKIEEVPEAAWEEMKERGGMIELYLRAIRGEFSTSSRLALKGFFDSLPGFNLRNAMNGKAQESKASEQYGFLSMQLTKPLGGMADDFGHIFNTPLGEVDIEDVVLNRRILIVLLPALQKAEEEMRNCGKIVVSNVKMTMAKVSGATLQGGFSEIIEADQTRAPSPFIVVLDEVGYYMVNGIDVMMAQARSLGFCIILAGQDMSAMQKVSAQIAETALANASTLAVGKTVDGAKTMEYVSKVIGEEQIAVTQGMQARETALGRKWVERPEVSFTQTARVKVQDLQDMAPGQFYFLFDSKLELARTFYIGENFAPEFAVNRFLKVRGPLDRVPGLDQSVEEAFTRALQAVAVGLANGEPAPEIDAEGAGESLVRECCEAAAAVTGPARMDALLEVLAGDMEDEDLPSRPEAEAGEDDGDAALAALASEEEENAGGGPDLGIRPDDEPDDAPEEEEQSLPEPKPSPVSAKHVQMAVSGASSRERFTGILGMLLAESKVMEDVTDERPAVQEDQPVSEQMDRLEGSLEALLAIGARPSASQRGSAGGPPSAEAALRGRARLASLERPAPSSHSEAA